MTHYRVFLIIPKTTPFNSAIVYEHVQMLSAKVLPDSTVVPTHCVTTGAGPQVLLLVGFGVQPPTLLVMCNFKMFGPFLLSFQFTLTTKTLVGPMLQFLMSLDSNFCQVIFTNIKCCLLFTWFFLWLCCRRSGTAFTSLRSQLGEPGGSRAASFLFLEAEEESSGTGKEKTSAALAAPAVPVALVKMLQPERTVVVDCEAEKAHSTNL